MVKALLLKGLSAKFGQVSRKQIDIIKETEEVLNMSPFPHLLQVSTADCSDP